MRRIGALLLAAVTAAGVLTGCRWGMNSIARSGFLLDTTISVTLYQTADTSLLDACFDKIRQYEALFSRTREGSDVWRINHAQGQPVEVSEDTARILLLCRQYSELSGGAFDATIAPVSSLWNFTQNSPSLPDTEALQTAVKLVDYRQVSVTPSAEGSAPIVQLRNPRAEIDLGGIAKGYIADRLHEYLTGQEIAAAIIDLGGNIYAVGSKKGKPWSIGVRNPADTQQLAATVPVTDSSVVTSGVYERSFALDGVLYHHILDPSTGQPVHNGLASVTIVCPRSADADALSTACFVLGQEKGLALIEALPDTEALFIGEDGRMMASAGLTYTANG